ncbi:MAG: hypothetical protein SPJ70_05505, partial [Candidatus Borkfalkiaceae bacterium]|nr:hypothetical protein [Christensenellaceae bacterium]
CRQVGAAAAAYFNNSNKPFLCERNKGKVFVLERKRILLQKRNKGIGSLLFSDGEKVCKKAAVRGLHAVKYSDLRCNER